MAASAPKGRANPATEAESPLTDKTVSAAHEAIDSLSERVARTERSVRGMVNDSSENLSARQAEMKAKVDESLDSARGYARENPLMTVGIAFAAGALVAALLRRR